MSFINKILKDLVYNLTKKPEHYVHVDKPKTLQDYRQIQFNNWSRAKGVYSGSYLPLNGHTLLRKGWVETTHTDNEKNHEFTRKSTGQRVRFDPESDVQIAHYHWYNHKPTIRGHSKKTKYLDRYGKPCTDKDHQRHLAPLDRDCPKNAVKRYKK